MKKLASAFSALLFVFMGAAAWAQTPLGTAFTYQGRLSDGGSPPTGVYDLRFQLFDAAASGAQIGSTVTLSSVGVTNGLFSVRLDFGASAFAGSARWVEIGVRPGGSPNPFTVLSPRQELTPAPDAIFSSTAPWSGLIGKPAGFADDVDNDSGGDITAVNAGTGLTGGATSGIATLSADTTVLQSRITRTCAPGSSIRVVDQSGSVTCQPDTDTTGNDWHLTGNVGNPAGAFVGTTDSQPLEFRVNGSRALRLEPALFGENNVIGGASLNVVDAGIYGATICGGGQTFTAGRNRVTSIYGTVCGGAGNTAGNVATVAGGGSNVAGGAFAMIPGGESNRAGGWYSFAAGRRAMVRDDVQSGDFDGDEGTFVWADAQDADFPSTGPNQFLVRAAGGVGINKNGPSSALDVSGTATMTGFKLTTAPSNGHVLTSDAAGVGTWQPAPASAGDITGVTAGTGLTGGGASGDVSLAANFTSSGGDAGTATTVARGDHLHDVRYFTEAELSTAGTINSASNPVDWTRLKSVPAGVADGVDAEGNDWRLTGNAGTNPATNFLGTTDAQALDLRVNNDRALRLEPTALIVNLIGGFAGNSVAVGRVGAAIGGGGFAGAFHRVLNDYGAIGGGYGNTAGATSGFAAIPNAATVAGGGFNTAGGFVSTVSGGQGNMALAQGATVSGGQNNVASGYGAIVAGGEGNLAGGDLSFAAGLQARVRDAAAPGAGSDGDEGTFVWADANFADFTSTGPNQFLVRAAGGVGINTNAPQGELQLGNAADATAFRFGNAGARHHLISNRDMVFDAYSPFVGPLFYWRNDFTQFDEGGGSFDLMTLSSFGDLAVAGTLTKGGGSFKIDHPLDPRNKTLSHSFVESPDMMNVYNGNVTTGGDGFATVDLPEWFEALNRDFRYQLTVIGTGAWARARVAREMEHNRFVIETDVPGTRVSWQVTGIRRDAWAEKHRIPVEEDKPHAERGRFLHPDAFATAVASAPR